MTHWQYGLLLDSAEAFIAWLKGKQTAKIISVHVHHTYKPDHSNFTGSNHVQLSNGMRKYHLSKGWSDIAQHITIYPDGRIVTGRNINMPPASATGYNDSDSDHQHPFMFELLGNFDYGHDPFEGKQKETALKITRYFFDQGAEIVFHRQCLIHGKQPKSCPGTGIEYTQFVSEVKSINSRNKNIQRKIGNRLLHLTSPMMKGEDVKRVQKKVAVTVDGIYGPITKRAVIRFQKERGLVPDGIVGPNTWEKILAK